MNKLYIFCIISTIYGLVNGLAYNKYSKEIQHYEPFGINNYNFTNECHKSGLMCADCETLVNCIETSPGEFITIPIQTCDKDVNDTKETCLINECSTKPNRQCTDIDSKPFECHNTGVFPDPLDCQVYHMCVEDKDALLPNGKFNYIGAKCDGLYIYNPVTTYCDKLMVNNACPSMPSVPACYKLAQSGPVPGTSIFYICLGTPENLIAHLYMCPHGRKFVNGKCS